MITDMITMVASDALMVFADEEFVRGSAKTRESVIKSKLGKEYPGDIVDYLASSSMESLTKDFSQISPYLGRKESLLPEYKQLEQNGFLRAFVKAVENELPELEVSKKSNLGKWLDERIGDEKMGGLMNRILLRELQIMLDEWVDIESPIIQVATKIDEKQMKKLNLQIVQKMKGKAQVMVNEDLIGGMRIFTKGQVIDNSWRAKLNKFFTALR